MLWIKFGIAMIILFTVIAIFNRTLRKLFKIEKEKKDFFSSYVHVSKLHQRVDWVIRVGTGITTIILGYFMLFQSLSLTLFLLIMLGLLILDYTVRAAFEWKYAKHPKQFILTLNEMTWLVIGVILIFQFDVLNLS